MDPISRLKLAYAEPLAEAQRRAASGQPVVALTSQTVPVELIEAAGCFPVLLRATPASRHWSGKYMEDVFAPHIRDTFDYLAHGEGSWLRRVVIPRTSEQEHKLFLYLRELQREQPGIAMPEVLLYNLLHARSAAARTYGLQTTRLLTAELERAGTAMSAQSLLHAVETTNRCRDALRLLMALRTGGQPRVTGTESMQMVGAMYQMDRADYAATLASVVAELRNRSPLPGPRVMIKGLPLRHARLHAALEQHGAVVVAEDDAAGSRATMPHVDADGDLFEAVFDACYLHAPGPRVFPAEQADAWFLQAAAAVDAVVFYLPPQDDVFGWDYPRWTAALNGMRVPHFLMRHDAEQPLPATFHDHFHSFVHTLRAGG